MKKKVGADWILQLCICTAILFAIISPTVISAPVEEQDGVKNQNEQNKVMANGDLTAMMVYFDNGVVETPRNRTWNQTAWSVEYDALAIGTDENICMVLESGTARLDEMILAVSDLGLDMNVQVWDGLTWGNQLELVDVLSGTDYRPFDVAYETLSGDAVIAYYNFSSGDMFPKYRIWDGNTWTAELSAQNTGILDINYLALVSNPNSDEILMVTLDANKEIYAQVWDGNSWGNTVLLETTASFEGLQCFDVEYESQSGYGLIVWGGNSDSDQNMTYRRWKGDWSEPAGNLTLAGDRVNWVRLAADPKTNHIISGNLDNNFEIDVQIWDGTVWSGVTHATVDAQINNRRCFDVAWEENGTTEGLIVYGENVNDNDELPRCRNITGTTVGPEYYALDANPVGNGEPQWVVLESDPLSDDIMLLYMNYINPGPLDDLGAELWNGTGWEKNQNVETISHTGFGQRFDIAYKKGIPVTQTPDHLEYLSGDDQVGVVDTDVNPIIFKILNETGTPVPGVIVNYTIYSKPIGATNHNFIENGQPWYEDVSDASGNVSATLHLGTKAGDYRVNVSASGLTGNAGPTYNDTINVTATVGPLASLDAVANPATVPVTGNSALTIWANDTLGNGITGLAMNIAFDANPSTPGEGVTSPAADLGGGVYSATYTAGQNAWVTDIINASSGILWNTTGIDVIPGPLASIEMVANPYSVNAGGNSALDIWANDSFDNGIPGQLVNVAFDANPSAPGENVVDPAIDNGDGTYSSTYTAGTTTGVTDIVNATSGVFWHNRSINVTGDVLASIEMVAGPAVVAVTGTSILTIWANDSVGSGIPGLTIDVSFDANPSNPGTGVTTPAADLGAGVYSAIYTAGQTAWVIDSINASSGGVWNTTNISVIAGPPTALDISSNLSTVIVQNNAALTVWLNDTFDNGCPGQVVDLVFDSPASSPSHNVVSPAIDNGGGMYSSTYTAGETAFVTDIVNATSGGLWDTVNIDVIADVPYSLSYVSGNGQNNLPDENLNEPFQVLVEDQYGNPIPGVEVSWNVNGTPVGASGHAINPALNTTNVSGIAGSKLTLGNLLGWYFVSASNDTLALIGEPVVFSAEARPPPLHLIRISGDGQSATAGTALGQPFVTEVRYDDGTTVGPGIPVWLNITTTGLSGDGSLSTGSPIMTDGAGRVQTVMTTDSLAGINIMSAEISSSGTSGVVFNAEGTLPNVATSLSVNATKVIAGQTFSYLLSFDNSGTEDAPHAWLNMTLDPALVYRSDTSIVSPAISGDHYSWHFTPLAAGAHSFSVICQADASTPNGTVIPNHFSVDYLDGIGRSMPRSTSNTIRVTILAEEDAGHIIFNQPPTIEGVPDLVVHHDWDYVIDLLPYIEDPDDGPSELSLILSDNTNVRIDPNNNLGIILNYSIAYLGTVQPLRITVTDGLGSDWDFILVRITEDFPPEVIDLIPDITMNEDSVAYPFNISHYFFDRDGDALFYTYGERNVNITFLENLTVMITPKPNWFGSEKVTFRAMDPSGALIEDTINIIVLPINDAPTIIAIPDQTGEVDIAWVLDLTPYVEDIDNLLSELMITTDSDLISVNGLNLTFRFSRPVELDIITITVSDGQAETFMQINVVVTGQIPFLDQLIPWLPPLIILVVLVLLAFFLLARKKTNIEQAFLIYMDGALLAHATSHLIPDMDTDIFSSMLTAIQDFVKDSFTDERDAALNRLEFGEKKISLTRSERGNFYVALVYSGDDKKVDDISERIVKDVNETHGEDLTDWDGNLTKLRGSREILQKYLS